MVGVGTQTIELHGAHQSRHNPTDKQRIADALLRHGRKVLSNGQNISVIFTHGDLTLDPATLQNGNYAIYAGGSLNLRPSADPASSNLTLLPPSPGQSHHCSMCRAKFSTENNLADHTFENPFGCEECAKCFHSKRSRDEHIATVHSFCVWCQRNLGLPINLEKHNRETHPICTWCHTSPFSSTEEHRKHNVENHKMCHLCEAFFKSKTSWDKHYQNIHFQCDVCDDWYESKDSRTAHFQASHCKCEFCGCVCQSLDQIQRHMEWYHPKCSLCPTSHAPYTAREDLVEHIENAHPQCNICEERFCSEAKRIKHLADDHPQCHICFVRHNSKLLFKKHLNDNHPKCSFCSSSARFRTRAACDEHREMKHSRPTPTFAAIPNYSSFDRSYGCHGFYPSRSGNFKTSKLRDDHIRKSPYHWL